MTTSGELNEKYKVLNKNSAAGDSTCDETGITSTYCQWQESRVPLRLVESCRRGWLFLTMCRKNGAQVRRFHSWITGFGVAARTIAPRTGAWVDTARAQAASVAPVVSTSSTSTTAA